MALNRLDNINVDVSELMNEADEGLWQEVGLIKNLDTLGVHSLGTHSISRPFATPARRLSGGSSVTPSFSTYLPGLSDTFPEVPKPCSGSSPQAEDRGVDIYSSRGKVSIKTLAPQKSRK